MIRTNMISRFKAYSWGLFPAVCLGIFFGCRETPPDNIIAQFDRPQDVALVCHRDVNGEIETLPLKCCGKDIDFGADWDEVKDYCGDRLCLLGNIDCQELLPNGTPAQVRQAVRTAIDDAAEGGGLIICSSNTLHPGVNPENCIAMFKATHMYGRYSK